MPCVVLVVLLSCMATATLSNNTTPWHHCDSAADSQPATAQCSDTPPTEVQLTLSCSNYTGCPLVEETHHPLYVVWRLHGGSHGHYRDDTYTQQLLESSSGDHGDDMPAQQAVGLCVTSRGWLVIPSEEVTSTMLNGVNVSCAIHINMSSGAAATTVCGSASFVVRLLRKWCSADSTYSHWYSRCPCNAYTCRPCVYTQHVHAVT